MNRIFRPADEADHQPVDFGSLRWISNPPSTGTRQLTALEAVIAPGTGHPFHVHPDQEEMIFVLSGRLEQWVDKDLRILGPGDAVVIPMGKVHASFNAGTEHLRMIATFGPSVGEIGFTMVDVAGEVPWSTLRP